MLQPGSVMERPQRKPFFAQIGQEKVSAIEERLQRKVTQAIADLQGLRESKTEDVFTKRYWLSPEDLYIVNYPRTRPLAAFNPGAVLKGEKVYIFPRLICDYYRYVSSIAVVEVGVEELIRNEIAKPLKTRIILWPEKPWEAIMGCEDARVCVVDGGFWVLYTAVGKHRINGNDVCKHVFGFAELDEGFTVHRKGFFTVEDDEGSLIPHNKDSALIAVRDRQASLLTRLTRIKECPNVCWRAECDLERLMMPASSLQPVLTAETWEYEVGWSTNVIQLAHDEYLVGWHGVLREDLSFRNGLAIVDAQGRLKAVSHYVLAPQGLWEQYGDRPLTIFGDGLLCYKDHLIWIGGVGDYCIGVFIAKLDDALACLRRV